jgi:Predicted transcriptional regulator
MKLSKSEEQLMEIIWNRETAFMKDLIEDYPEPKPAGTTIATLLKRMQNKGVIAYRVFGNSREYYPLISKKEYFSKHVNEIVKDFFGNSALQFASFFTTAGNLSEKELEELKKIVEQEIQRKKQ